jgi:hypothetical protein
MKNIVTMLIIITTVLPVAPTIDNQTVFFPPFCVSSVVNRCFSEELILKKENPDIDSLINRINFEEISLQNHIIGLEMYLAIKHGINPIIII